MYQSMIASEDSFSSPIEARKNVLMFLIYILLACSFSHDVTGIVHAMRNRTCIFWEIVFQCSLKSWWTTSLATLSSTSSAPQLAQQQSLADQRRKKKSKPLLPKRLGSDYIQIAEGTRSSNFATVTCVLLNRSFICWIKLSSMVSTMVLR